MVHIDAACLSGDRLCRVITDALQADLAHVLLDLTGVESSTDQVKSLNELADWLTRQPVELLPPDAALTRWAEHLLEEQ